ncbi:hypothetical protein GALMADRAFT_235853 [Galerina marginata CBS 339.88]|uniref:Nucleoporin NSP1 n=1 Tax=Galerina marginata (strain CBS 339.88) TaxID=685588 RepID=A0A067TUK2_GALM3|nr:hypothetical protein GALMADRAFT_235853 [Galerina marginata CBS 339.88]
MSFFNLPPTNNGNQGGNSSTLGGAPSSNSPNPNQPQSVFGNTFGGPASNNVFGGGTTSTPSGGGLFGATNSPLSVGNTAPTTPAPAGGLFGNAQSNSTSAPILAPGGLFGGANTSSNPGTGNVFGGAANSTSAPAPGILFGGGGSTTTPASNTFFGGGNKSTTTPPTNTNPLFGGSSAFALPKPGDTGAKPAASNFFNQPSTGTTSATVANPMTNAPTIGSGLFSLPSKPAAGTTANVTTAAPSAGTPSTTTGTGNLFGGGLFSQHTTATASSAPTSAFSLGGSKDSAAPATAGNNVFGASTGNKEGEKKATTPIAAPTFNLFGGAKPAEKKDETPSAKEGEKRDTTPSMATPTTNTTSAVAIAPPSMLRGKSLEEIVNRWTADLETNVREFNKFAAEVSVWDRALIENGNNIAALYSHVLAVERQQNEINESLQHIEQQQQDLTSTLDAYERVSQEILGGSLRTLDTGPADNERDKNYMLATDLHTHLDDLSGSLTQMIDSVNALSIASKPADSADDPMSQISQILSSHLESLQWIDSAVRDVENKTQEVEKHIKESGQSLSGSKPRGFGVSR